MESILYGIQKMFEGIPKTTILKLKNVLSSTSKCEILENFKFTTS